MEFKVLVASEDHLEYAEVICLMIEEAAQARGTGIAKREAEYIQTKMRQGKAIIALHGDQVAGFCYIETWGHKQICGQFRTDCQCKFSRSGIGKINQTQSLRTFPRKVSQCQAVWDYHQPGCDEN